MAVVVFVVGGLIVFSFLIPFPPSSLSLSLPPAFNFVARTAALCGECFDKHGKKEGETKALDVGCAVGGSSFELIKKFDVCCLFFLFFFFSFFFFPSLPPPLPPPLPLFLTPIPLSPPSPPFSPIPESRRIRFLKSLRPNRPKNASRKNTHLFFSSIWRDF